MPLDEDAANVSNAASPAFSRSLKYTRRNRAALFGNRNIRRGASAPPLGHFILWEIEGDRSEPSAIECRMFGCRRL